MTFWYRSSPSLLEPVDENSGVTLSDPPPIQPGMVRVDLDPSGRLTGFYAVPTRSNVAATAGVNWDALFQAARLDKTTFTEIEPKVLPRFYADETKAWSGELPELPGVPFRIDAAGLLGRPTAYILIGPWATGDGGSASRPPPIVQAIGMFIIAAVPIGAALLARRNLRLGRGDRRGAFRTWAAAFGVGVIGYVASPNHVPGLEEIDRMFAALGALLFWSSVLFVVYLALEPYVRRTLPGILITWSRLVSGRVLDPLVGRDLIVGILAGLIVSLIEPAMSLAMRLSGQTPPTLSTPALTPLFGWRHTLTSILNVPFNALIDAMMVVLLLLVIRQGLKGLASRLPGAAARAIGSGWEFVLVSLVLFLIVIKRQSLDPTHPLVDIAGSILVILALLTVALRFGLVALVVAFFVSHLAGESALTLDPTRVYAGHVWFLMAIVIGLAIAGYWLARGSYRGRTRA